MACASVTGTTPIGSQTELAGDSTSFFNSVHGYTSTNCKGTAYVDGSSGLEVCHIPGVKSFAGLWGLGGCSHCP